MKVIRRRGSRRTQTAKESFVTTIRALLIGIVLLLVIGAPALAQEDLEGEGEIGDSNETVEFDLALAQGQTVTITTDVTSGDLDTTLELIDPDGDTVADNDDMGDGSYNSQVVYTADRAGTYTIVVGRYDDSTRGEFRVLIEFGDTSASGGNGVGDSSGNSGISDERDTLQGEGSLDDVVNSEFYELDLDRGDTVTITTEATSGDLDTIIILRDPNGDTVAENDDIANGNLNSQVIYTASEGGTYEIEVTRYDETSEGDYIITVEFSSEGGGGGVDGQVSVDDEQQIFAAEGTIDDGSESESWEIDLQAGTIVVINANKTSGNLDTYLTLIDPNGDIVAENDDRGDGTYNSEITYEVADSGTHVIVVERYDSSTDGDYELIVTTDPNATPDFSFVDVEGDVLAQFEDSIDSDGEVSFDVDLSAGQSIYASSEATSGDLDTVLTLISPSGETLAINDDRGDGTLNSALAYTVEETGTYTLEVTRYEGGDSEGDFVLVVQLVDASVAVDIADISDQAVSLSGPTEIIETDHFRIFYTQVGSDGATEDYARAFAETLEEMYDLQINRIGWYAPPAGDDGLYDAYLADVIGTELGALAYARPVDFVGDNPNSPIREARSAEGILVVDNDYYIEGADINPQALMRASTTHEFNHLVQFGYDADEDLFWLFEATAVWTETITVGDEQDATGYIDQNNEYPELCFATEEFDGSLAYGDWTLLETIADRHGEAAVLRMWENAIDFEGLDVMERTLEEYGDTLSDAVAYWRVANLAMDYELGALIPRPVWIEDTIDDFGDWTFRGDGIQELGANYFTIDLNGSITLQLNGSNDLQLWFVGIRGDDGEAYLLGDGGTVDLGGYDSAFAMVVNSDVPQNLGGCDFVDYEIEVSEGGGAAAPITVTLNAQHFQEPR
jgi:subtilisin-like proprotein convertase family protein